MELFSELYSCYYQVVNHILTSATTPLSRKDITSICDTYGYKESALSILPKLLSGEWNLLRETDNKLYISKLKHSIKVPLTTLQLSWISALLSDKRIQLFFSAKDLEEQLQSLLEGIKPFYLPEDFHYYDQYSDGDDFSSKTYQKIFRTLLHALKNSRTVLVTYQKKKEEQTELTVFPLEIEYSSKNDKFRLKAIRIISEAHRIPITLNLGRILACKQLASYMDTKIKHLQNPNQYLCNSPVQIEISNERNSLERCMLTFSSYEKWTEYDEERGLYICSIYYDKQDETELLIQLLSFGPTIRVIGPPSFLQQLKQRVEKQKEWSIKFEILS